MQCKPVVLILTSSDERGGAAENYAAAISADGKFNTVVLGEDKYGAKDIFGKHSKAAFRPIGRNGKKENLSWNS